MKILCIRLKAIGDLVVTTPVYRALAEQLGAEVHVLAMALPAQMLLHNPHVARHIDYDQPGLVALLKREEYDLVVDLHCNLRSHKLRLQLGRPSLGYFKRNLDKKLLSYGINRLGTEHIVHRYFRALAPLGVQYDGRGLDYFPTAAELDAATSLPGLHQPYLALVLAATHHTKRIPPQRAAEIVAESPHPVALLGGADVAHLAAEVEQLTPEGKTINLVDKLPLRVSIAVLAKAETVITPDTGLMHVAAALRKPIVAVWGNTAPSYGMYPWLPQAMQERVAYAEVQGLSCHPCSRIGYASCPLGHFKCMHDQSPHHIIEQAAEVTRQVETV